MLNINGGIIGEVKMYASNTIPDGWLSCDGSAISRTTYSALFAVVGTTWGVGDGSTTFNIPDLRGRSVIGVGTGPGLSPRSLAAIGGEEFHLLDITEMPPHKHDYKNRGDSSFFAGADVGGGDDFDSPTSNTGGGLAHNTMHPFAAMNCIIKF